MLKSIPKSDISIKEFPVHKEWIITQLDSPVITATDEPALFDPDTSNYESGVYTHPLYHSVKNKYYNARGNVFNQYGIMRNPAEWEWERYYGETIYVIALPQLQYGEQIKKGSISLVDMEHTGSDGGDLIFTDDSFGNIQSDIPSYIFTSYDAETQIMVFDDQNGNGPYNVVCSFFDVNSGLAIFTLDGETDNYYVAQIDFQTNIILMDRPLIFDDTVIGNVYNGNAFYDDGLIVLTNISPFSTYELTYRSTQTIYETEVLVSINKGEFNYSQNPTAVTTILENEYDFETTKITNYKPAGTVHIKTIQDLYQTPKYFGTVGSATGSWDDYYTNGSTDPTGSYLTPFVSTIGLYDENYDLVAVAKLPSPIKKLPNYDLNFLIRFDT